MADFNQNLWAPWRMEYIRSLGDQAKDEGCFLCSYYAEPDRDKDNRVLWRTEQAFVVMNRFPYTNGHLLVALGSHVGDFTNLNDSQLSELTLAIRDGVGLLKDALNPHGFNIGYNLGRCAGAGLPDHLHAHIVPRWSGDTNYMAVLGDIRIVPDSLDALWADLSKRAIEAGLRS